MRAAPRLLLDAGSFVFVPPAQPSFGSDIPWHDAVASAARSAASLAVTSLGNGFWAYSSPTLREDLLAAGAHFKKDLKKHDSVEDDPFHDDWAYLPWLLDPL